MSTAASAPIVSNAVLKGSVQYATDQYLLMTNGIVFGNNTTPFSIRASFYPTSSRIAIIGGHEAFFDRCLSILARDSQNQIRADAAGAGVLDFNFATAYNLNAWNDIAVVRDADGYVQIWLNGVASSTGRQQFSSFVGNFFNPTRAIGAFVNASFYNNTTKISTLRVTNTAEFATTLSTIPRITASLENITGTQLLMNGKEFIDQSGVQTLTPSSNSPTQSNVSNF